MTEPPPSDSGWAGAAKYGAAAAKAALTALVAWFVWRSVESQLADIGGIDWKSVDVDLALLLLSFAVLFGELAVGAWCWSTLVARLGGPRVSVPTAAAMVVLANFGRYVPGKLLGIVGVAALAGRARCPASVAAAASLASQALHLLGAVIVSGWTMLQLSGLSSGSAAAVGAALLIMVAALAVLAGHARVHAALVGALARIGRRRPSDVPLDFRSISGLASLPWVAAFVAQWFVYGLAFFLLARSLGADGSLLFYTTAFAGAYLTGYVAVLAPAGLGVREATLVALLAPTLGAGPSVVLAVAQRAWITAFELAAAPGCVAVFWRRGRKA